MRLPALCLILLPFLATGPARAAESYDNCTGFVDSLPAVIATQGTWCLRGDLATAIDSGAAIEIASNNVTLDCNHFKIGGLSAGPATFAYGVRASSRLAVRLRNCNVRGFFTGLFLELGAGHVIEHNRLEGNTFYGIAVTADQTIIRHNQVLDTGGSTSVNYGVVAIGAAGEGNDVLDNHVSGVDALALDATAWGISLADDGPGTAARNTVRGLDPDTTGEVIGIRSTGGHPILFENILQGVPGSPQAIGIQCAGTQATARANVLAKFATGVAGCLASGNIVNTN